MASKILLSTVLALLGVLAARAEAFPIHEASDVDKRDVADDSHPGSILSIETASANGGVLQLVGGAFLERFTHESFFDDIVISSQIEAKSSGDRSVGMEYGDRRFLFHPGFPGGAFQIKNATDGNSLVSRLDMGFTPSAKGIYSMILAWAETLNQLTVTIADGARVADPFVFVWTPDEGFDPAGFVGSIYHDGINAGP